MNRYETFNFFSYAWSFEDEDTRQNGLQNIIRIYGWNEKNESVYIRVEDFPIPMYIDLPMDLEWTESRISAVSNALLAMGRYKWEKPMQLISEDKFRSHYAHVEKIPTKKNGIKYKRKKFPFITALFSNSKGCHKFADALKKDINVPGLGRIRLKCHATEKTITPVLKFLGIKNVPSAGWMRVKGVKLSGSEKETTRKHEYAISHDDISALSEEEALKMPIVLPKVLSFDNEAYSSDKSRMPQANVPDDKTFQIGYTILDPAKNGKPKTYRKYLLTLGKPQNIEGTTIKRCKSETALYLQLTKDIIAEDPEVILGYNILGWDINYMIERCKSEYCNCLGEFDMMGCVEGKHATEETIKWGSSAYGQQSFKYLDAQGRLFVDMLPYVKRTYKLPNYRLETVCDEFLKVNKDPLKIKDMFKLYEQFTPEALETIGTYCVQDSYVCLLLYEKLLTWFDLTESATTNKVPMFDMITKGQQIKMYSQVYSHCFHEDIVIESGAYEAKDNEHYTGAYVSEPEKGMYENVVPFDFASLYPSIMRAYNIDYSSMVLSDGIPDEDCHVMEWSEHAFCRCALDTKPANKKAPKLKDGGDKRVCANYKYRWLKHQVVGKGILPTLLEKLLKARKNTRKIIEMNCHETNVLKKILVKEYLISDYVEGWGKRMEKYATEGKVPAMELVINKCVTNGVVNTRSIIDDKDVLVIKDRIDNLESLNQILDRRQNAYKVNANSIYGACGAKKGYAPFLPAAMCVTFMGRTNILKTNDFIANKYGATVIYNDTDSAYCSFPEFRDKPVHELWAHAETIVRDIKSEFPEEISLEFEGKVYKKFIIFSKKRYAAVSVNKEGKIDSKLMKRGIVLQRRDNCKILRDIYQSFLFGLFDNHEELVKLKTITNKAMIFRHPVVRELLNMVVFAIDNVFRWSYTTKDGSRKSQHIRDFVVTKAMSREPSEYKNPDRLPSHVYLATKMQKRGMPIGAGTRVEYVVCKDEFKPFKKSETQKERICDIDYFIEFREIFRLCRLTYMKTFINPLDELCRVGLGIDDFVKEQWNIRIKFSQVIDRIKRLSEPKITLID